MAIRIFRRLISERYWLAVMIALALVAMVAACGGSDATPTGDPSPGSSLASPAPGANGTASVGALESDAIIAAHEEVLARIYEALLPSVVHIRVIRQIDSNGAGQPLPGVPDAPLPDFPGEFFHRGEGSGFVWDEAGHIVTNNHVVDGADRVAVIFSDGAELHAEVIGTDPDSDLAVLELSEPKSGASPVDLGDSDDLRVGQIALAIGNPFGQEFTMTSGIISALGRTIRSGGSPFSIPEVIQSDAAINPGNSGGPLLDRHGKVIGVNTQIISRSGASSGVGFSVPINTAKRVVPALIEEGRYEYSWLGISGSTLRADLAELMDLPRDTSGALVSQVTVDSPADKAGLRGSDRTAVLDGVDYPVGGDVIVSINGWAVDDMDDLIAYLSSNTRPGDKVALEVIRDGEGEDLEVSLGARPDSDG